jgi:2-polyprenyl-6-methoxyphenol hydroxylase-like FAD-dependent oxidoreductase
MASETPSKHILIIGGGIAGKALSLFLHEASTHPLSINKFTSTIYESYPKSEKLYLGGGLGLAPNGVAVLDSLGLGDLLRERAGIARQSTFWSEGGTELGRWDHDRTGQFGEAMYGLMRATLYDILSEDLDKKGLTIEYQKKAVKVEEKGDKVVVYFEDGTTAEGDYLVACDGNSHPENANNRCPFRCENTSLS